MDVHDVPAYVYMFIYICTRVGYTDADAGVHQRCPPNLLAWGPQSVGARTCGRINARVLHSHTQHVGTHLAGGYPFYKKKIKPMGGIAVLSSGPLS